MRPLRLLLLVTFLSSIIWPSAATAGVREDRPNFIGGEVLGRGVAVTLNYERYLTNEVGLGAGLMAFGTSGGGVTIVPLYVSVLPGNVHSPYLSAGATLLAGGGDLQDWESTWLLHFSFGYQYSSPSGFFVRPFFTYLRPTERGSGDAFLVWPGLTIGGSF